MRRFTVREKEEITALYNSELGIKAIGKKFNRHPQVISELLKRSGITLRGATKKVIDIERALEMYKNGDSIWTIARVLHSSYRTIRRCLVENGAEIRPTGGKGMWLAFSQKHPDKTIGRLKTPQGYVKVRKPEHHRADVNGYVFEHILVWEETHGQVLPDDWIVHHLNGIKDDNRPENLVALPRRVHQGGKKLKDLFIAKLRGRIRNLEAKLGQGKLPIGGV